MNLDHAGKELAPHVSGHREAVATVEAEGVEGRRVGDDVQNGGRGGTERGADRREQLCADALAPPGPIDGDRVEVIGLNRLVIDRISDRRRAVDSADAVRCAAGDVVQLAFERGVIAGAHILRGDGEQPGAVLAAGQWDESHRSRASWYVWLRHDSSSITFRAPISAATISDTRSHDSAKRRM